MWSIDSWDTAAALQTWETTYTPTWPDLLDSAGTVDDAYGVTAAPTLIIIDTGGVVRFTHVGNPGSATLISEIQSLIPANQPPVANFVWSPDPGTAGSPVSFDGTGSSDPDGTIVSYAWTFGDGGTGTGASPSHTYAADGDYSVKLTVTDDDGATGSITKTVHIGAPPVRVPTIESCDSTGATKNTFQPSDKVYGTGTNYVASTTYSVYVVADVTWVDGMAIPARVSGTATSVSSDASGNVPATLLWSSPLVPGKYDIVVDVNGNGKYDKSIDALDDNDVQVTAGFFVIPELYLGTILGLTACFAAFGILYMHKRRLL